MTRFRVSLFNENGIDTEWVVFAKDATHAKIEAWRKFRAVDKDMEFPPAWTEPVAVEEIERAT